MTNIFVNCLLKNKINAKGVLYIFSIQIQIVGNMIVIEIGAEKKYLQ